MENPKKIYNNKKETIIQTILIVASFLSLFPDKVYLRCIGLSILIVNFLFFKRYVKGTFVIFTIAIFIIVIGLILFKALEETTKDFFKEGYNENGRITIQKDLNELARNIDNYILQNGHLPQNIKIMQKNSMVKDVSYNLKEGDISHPYFYYEILDSNYYYVSGIGRDGIGRTEDDIVPRGGKYFRKK